MKIAISNIAWNPEEEDEILTFLSQNGILLLEVAPTKYWNDPSTVSSIEIETKKRHLNDAGFEVIAAQALFFGRPELSIFGDEKLRRTTLDYLCRVSETCVRLGAKALVFGSPKNRLKRDISDQVASEIAVDFFHMAAEYVFALGGILCVEPNPVEYGCDFINTTKQAVAFVEQVNHPGLRVQLDTSAMTLNGEKPFESIENGLAWAGHFHVSEPFLGLVGKGKTDHAVIAKELQSRSFNRPLSIEMRSGLAATNKLAVEDAIRFVKAIYPQQGH